MKIKFSIFIILISLYSFFTQADIINNETYLKEFNNDVVLGNHNAPITMIEYSSFSCPHCAYFHNNVFDILKKEYIDTGKLKYIHRDYPLDKAAFAGSVLAHCAGKEKYFLFLKVLFYKQENWVFQKNYLELLENIGKLGGIDGAKFQQCMADKTLEKQILESRMIASNNLNIVGTPHFFINGMGYPGMHKLDFFKDIFEKILHK